MNGFVRAAAVARRRPQDDALRLGQSALFSTAARADRPLLRRRRRRARAGALPLAAAAAGRIRRCSLLHGLNALERRALHERHRQQGVRARHERRPAESAQLRRDRASVGRPVSLGPDGRRRGTSSRSSSAIDGLPADGGRRLLARRQPRAEAGGRVRRRAAAGASRRSRPCRRSSRSPNASARSNAARTPCTSGIS